MTRRLTTRLVLLAVCVVMCWSVSVSSACADGSPVPGQVVVKIHKWANINDVVGQCGGRSIDLIIDKSTYLIEITGFYSVEEVIDQLSSNPAVIWVQPNTTLELPESHQMSQGFPDQRATIFIKGNEPLAYYQQPAVYTTGIDSAHTLSTGEGVKVAVIDNGLIETHPVVAAADVKHGYDFIHRGADPAEIEGDLYGHGTAVTVLLLLTAPDCTIMPLQAFNENGIGDQYAVAKAVHWAIRHKASVINMSFGTTSPDNVMTEAVADAIEAGLTIVASTGNEATSTPSYPAAYPDVIAVTSFDTLEVLASFANYGDYVDICAPGVKLYSAYPGSSGWGVWSGTSFSAPLVTGTVALMRSVGAWMTQDEVRGTVQDAARKKLMWGSIVPPDPSYGYGALDAYHAVKNVPVGDLDRSGRVDFDDIQRLIDILKDGPDADEDTQLWERADVNCDGRVDISDVSVMIQTLMVKKDTVRPCKP